VILAIIPVMGSASALQLKALTGFSKKSKELNEEAASIATEAVGSIRTVASLSIEKKLADMYNQRLEYPYQVGVRKAYISSLIFGFSQGVVFLGNALALW
jgi:ATP-binding cassette subfamily B (MDR/TAP) protein 1